MSETRPVAFDVETANALLDMLDGETYAGSSGGRSSTGRSVDGYFVRITSTTPSSGRYPGTRYSYDAIDNAFTAEDTIWVVEVNGATPATGTYYPALRSGEAADRPVWLIKKSVSSASGIEIISSGSFPAQATGSNVLFVTDTSSTVDPVFVAASSTVTLYLSPASATVTGLVVPFAQTWAGNKTFTGNIYVTNTAPVVGVRNTTGGLGASQILISYGDYVANPTVNTLQVVADSATTSYIGTYHAGLSGGYSVGLIYNSLAGTLALSASNGSGTIIAGAFVVSIAGGTYATGQTGTLVDGSVVNGGIITSIGTDGMTYNRTYRLMSMGLH